MSADLPLTVARFTSLQEQGLVTHGAQLYVSMAGEVVADFAIGEARPGVDFLPTSVCRQSCTAKPVIALAVARLVSEGLLRLDTPVQDVLPRFGRNGKGGVTVAHLLNHTAGVTTASLPRVPASEAEALQHAYDAQQPPGWRVGEDAGYSSLLGWHVLGEIIQTVTTQSLRTFLRQEILVPLMMLDSWIGMTVDEYRAIEPRLALNYYAFENFGDLTPLWVDLEEATCVMTIPSNGAYMPSHDLGRLYEALLEPDLITLSSLSIDPAVFRQFLEPQRPRTWDRGLMRVCDFGFGFMLNGYEHQFGERCSSRSYGHSGARGSSMAFADPEQGLVVALLFTDIIDWETSFLRRIGVVNAIYRDLCPRAPQSVQEPESGSGPRWTFRRRSRP